MGGEGVGSPQRGTGRRSRHSSEAWSHVLIGGQRGSREGRPTMRPYQMGAHRGGPLGSQKGLKGRGLVCEHRGPSLGTKQGRVRVASAFRLLLVCVCLAPGTIGAAERRSSPSLSSVQLVKAGRKMEVSAEEHTGTATEIAADTSSNGSDSTTSTSASASNGSSGSGSSGSSSSGSRPSTSSSVLAVLAPHPHAVPDTRAPAEAPGLDGVLSSPSTDAQQALGGQTEPGTSSSDPAILAPHPHAVPDTRAPAEAPGLDGVLSSPSTDAQQGLGELTEPGTSTPLAASAIAPSPDTSSSNSSSSSRSSTSSSSSISAVPGEWHPQRGKFLLAYCLFGRLSNELFCMRTYLKVAQVTNRVLLIPTWNDAMNVAYTLEYSFPWDVPVDWARMAQCLAPGYGPQTVMTVKQYLEQYNKTTVNVTYFRSLHKNRDWAVQGGVAEREFRRLNSQLQFPPWSSIPETGLVQHIEGRPSAGAVASAAAAIPDDVISFGELFNFDFDSPLPPLRLADKACSNLWRPHPGIVQFVGGLIDAKIQGAYGAVHLRRGDFYGYMTDWGKTKLRRASFLPISEAAVQIREWLRNDNITRLFIATNARKHELEVYKALVQERSEDHQVEVALSLRDVLGDPQWLKRQSWAQAALELNALPGSGGIVWSIIDKYMCVFAQRFYGSASSTFSGEIDWMLRPDESRSK